VSAPVVLLHGSFGCGEDWREVADQLNCGAVTPDLPAHGARFEDVALSFDHAADEVARRLPEGCDLVGYSLGGRLALAAALRVPPGRVRSLTLESTHPGLEPPARERRRRHDLERSAAIASDPEAFLREFYAAPLFESFRTRPRFEAVIRERITRARRSPKSLAQTFAALSVGNQPALASALLDAEIPTMLIVGERDTKYAALASGLVASPNARPDLAMTAVSAAGHNVHLERPEAFVDALRAFWEGLQ